MFAASLGALSVAYSRHPPEKEVVNALPVTFRNARTHTRLLYDTRSVARFARPLLACAYISFMCLLRGRLLLPLYSMSELNNNGSKARYSNRPASLIIS